MLVRRLIPKLEQTRFFHPLRNAYLRTLKPRYWKDRVESLRGFYRQFVRKESLVFDVGANTGEYTEVFLHLGADVIAIEPQPNLVTALRRIHNKHLKIVLCAVGSQEGIQPLYVSTCSEVSSLRSEWLDVIANNDGWSEKPRRLGTIDVDVITLDVLIERFGLPDFIKIDVEGFEIEVLRGLSKLPKFLSFEFNSALIDSALTCLRCLPESEFNYTIGEPRRDMALALPNWVSNEQMNRIATNTLAGCRTFGDIFVRRPDLS